MKQIPTFDSNNNALDDATTNIETSEPIKNPIAQDSTSTQLHWPRVIKSRIKYDAPENSLCLARELIDAFKRHADRILLVDATDARQWTGAQLLKAAGSIACGLYDLVQVRPNDVVMTVCDHTTDETLVALGVVLSGAALYGVSLSDGFDENKSLCEIVKPDVLVIPKRWHADAIELIRQVEGMHTARIVWMASEQSDCDANNNPIEDKVTTFEDLIGHECDQNLLDTIADEWVDPLNHIATYMLTSGSTGRPKVVPTSQAEIVHGLMSMYSATKNRIGSGAQCANAFEPLDSSFEDAYALPITPDDRLAGDLPLDHGAGLNTMFLSFYMGAMFVRIPAYDVDAFWKSVSDFRISVSVSSTTFGFKLLAGLKQLIDANETGKYDISSFKFMVCCGAKLAYQALADDVCKVYKNLHVAQAYGCTEIGFITVAPLRDCHSHRQYVGFLLPGIECRLIERADDESELGSNDLKAVNKVMKPIDGPEKRGEFLVWSQSKFQGYRCHPDEVGRAERIFADCHLGKFYRTGDQVHMDPYGRLYVHGRFKDTLVLMEDWKIMPAELEQVIDMHPLVEQSAVVGTPDKELPGCDAPRAFCKLVRVGSSAYERLVDDQNTPKDVIALFEKNDKREIAKHIYEFAASRTAHPKHLKGGVCILDEFPLVGLLNKVDRNALRKMTHTDY